jgi:hypothetical protein
MEKSNLNRFKFFIVHAVKNIFRQIKRYIIMGLHVYVISSVAISLFMISVPANRFVSEWKPYYAPDGFYIAEEDLGNPDIPFSKSDVLEVESLYYSCSAIKFGLSVVGIAVLLFVSAMLVSERIYDTGIYYSLGMSRKFIFLNLFFEMAIFILALILAGTATAGIAVRVMFYKGLLPPALGDYLGIDGGVLCAVLFVTVAMIMIPSLILLNRIVKSSPAALLKEKI